MAGPGSQLDFLRIRLRRDDLVVPDPDLVGGGVLAFVGRVISSGTNIKVGYFLLVQPSFVLGPEAEGGSGAFTAFGSTTIPVYLIGPGTPSTGDYLICRFVDNRWVAERTSPGTSGGPTGMIPNCFCSPIPATLTMTSADPSCNFRMFQSCTIQYGPTPPAFLAANLPANSYLSTQGFPDPVSGGSIFYYYLTCQYNLWTLTRIFPVSPYGSPFRDAVLYTWVMGGYGNTCNPFHLDYGNAFPGSDLSCSVTIDAA